MSLRIHADLRSPIEKLFFIIDQEKSEVTRITASGAEGKTTVYAKEKSGTFVSA
jgi:hypothetical protein